MVSRLLIPLLLTGALALACGPRSHSEATSRNVSAEEQTAAQRAAARARREKHDGEIVPSLHVNASPHAVRFALAVENAGSKTLEMHFANGQTHDIVVLDAAGREVWRYSDGRLFTQAHKTKPLGGGDTLRVVEEWDASKLHGTFTAVAMLRSTNYPVERRVEFELP